MPADLVLLRHGQSTWNLENLFTGWTDVDLTPQGREEAARAGQAMKAEGLTFDLAYTSVLKRAIRTLWIALDEMDLLWVPVERNWILNERHYGALQGLDKVQAVKEHGDEQVHKWRRGFAITPPPLTEDDERHPRFEPAYRDLDPSVLPCTESLKITCDRVIPFWEKTIKPQVAAGRRIIIGAHGNSLRALVMHLDGLSEDEITKLNIPTGYPLVYSFDADMKPTGHRYLGDQAAIKAAIDGVANQTSAPPKES